MYSGYGIGSGSRSLFDWGRIVIVFGVDNSSSVHVDNKKIRYISTQ